jgi:putative CocE/NonD family hydrolase
VLKKTLCLLAFAFILLPNSVLGQAPAAAQAPGAIAVEKNVAMKTRDGVTLRADIYHPAAEGKYPVLLTRTPYNKDSMSPIGFKGAGRGFIVVVQDVRGRYNSEGEWYTFKNEINDGYDTVEWAAALPNSNGKVGMFSGSYVGATQMLAAIGHPPHLAGICPIVTASNYHENWTYQGGAFEQWFNESWTSSLAQDTLNRKVNEAKNALVGSTVLPLNQYPVFNLGAPHDGAALTHALAPYFLDWLDHPTYDDYWKQWSIEENYQNIQVPALTIAAWYDIFQGGSLRNYMGMKAHAGNEAARNGQHLIVAIGGHSGWGRTVGTVDFGPDAPFDENAVILDWYDYLFLGKQNEFANGKPVKIFVMGRNEWRYEDEWPLKRAKETRFYLHSGKRANSVSGDGRLFAGVVIPDIDSPDTYVYDPAEPVPTVGGPLCCDAVHLAPARATRRKSRPVPTCLFTPRRRSIRISKLPDL